MNFSMNVGIVLGHNTVSVIRLYFCKSIFGVDSVDEDTVSIVLYFCMRLPASCTACEVCELLLGAVSRLLM